MFLVYFNITSTQIIRLIYIVTASEALKERRRPKFSFTTNLVPNVLPHLAYYFFSFTSNLVSNLLRLFDTVTASEGTKERRRPRFSPLDAR